MMSRHCFTGTRWYLNFETVFTLQIWVESLKVSDHYFEKKPNSFNLGRLFGWCFCFESSLIKKSADASLMSKCQKRNFIQWNAIRKRPLFCPIVAQITKGTFLGPIGPKNYNSLSLLVCISCVWNSERLS